MAARTLKRSVKRRSAESVSAVLSATAAKKSADSKSARPARTALASSKTKPNSKPKQAKISGSARSKAPVSRTVLYCQSDGWDVIDVANGIAVHDSAFKSVHYLNHTAAIVFLLCKQPIGLDVLCAVFREEFGLKTAPKAEIRKIIAQMEVSGLLRTVQPGAVKADGAGPARKR
jgi:hypothetical protein